MRMSKYWSDEFGKKELGREGKCSSPPPQIVLVSKSGTRIVISIWVTPLPILYNHWFDTITLTKKKKRKTTQLINTHPSFFWQRLQNFTLLQMEAGKPCSMIFWYIESDGTIFIKMLWLFRGIPTLSKFNFYMHFHTNFLSLAAFDEYIKLD